MENKKFSLYFLVMFGALVLIVGYFFLNTEKKKEIYFLEDKEDKADSLPAEDIRNQDPSKNVDFSQETNTNETPVVKEKKVISQNNEVPEIINKLTSWGFSKAEGRKIDSIIIHSTYNSLGGNKFDTEKIIGIYKSYGVAPHYLISRDGKIYQLVEDKNIAFHAGVSSVPDGRTNVNNFSIGIEIINSKDTPPSSDQYVALKDLVDYLKSKYSVKYLLGHSDIAPGRKDDPWMFDWEKVR